MRATGRGTRSHRSFRGRTVALTWLTTAVIAACTTLLLLRSVRSAEESDAREHLRVLLDDVVAHLGEQGIADVDLLGLPDHGVIVRDSDGQVVARAGAARLITDAGLSTQVEIGGGPAPVDASAVADGLSGRYVVGAERVRVATGLVTVEAFGPVEADPGEQYFRIAAWLISPLLAVLITLTILVVVRRAIAPVAAMRCDLDEIGDTDLARRIDAGTANDEISALGRTINGLLERLDQAQHRQRRFAAAAAHELRSPLSAIRTELEVGLAYPAQSDWPTIAGESLVEVDRLEHLARDLLTLTRPSSERAMRSHLDLADLVRTEISRRRPGPGVSYASELGPAVVEAHADDLVPVLRNLMSNAERHARSEIRVTVTSGRDGTTLSVANDGPAIPADQREQIFEPFLRLDEARAFDDGGSGLGLAIVRSKVEAIGGSIEASDRRNGAEFVVRLPPGERTQIAGTLVELSQRSGPATALRSN
jgi:signal transduction histidine kinase